jgi:hypothetical protein
MTISAGRWLNDDWHCCIPAPFSTRDTCRSHQARMEDAQNIRHWRHAPTPTYFSASFVLALNVLYGSRQYEIWPVLLAATMGVVALVVVRQILPSGRMLPGNTAGGIAIDLEG